MFQKSSFKQNEGQNSIFALRIKKAFIRPIHCRTLCRNILHVGGALCIDSCMLYQRIYGVYYFIGRLLHLCEIRSFWFFQTLTFFVGWDKLGFLLSSTRNFFTLSLARPVYNMYVVCVISHWVAVVVIGNCFSDNWEGPFVEWPISLKELMTTRLSFLSSEGEQGKPDCIKSVHLHLFFELRIYATTAANLSNSNPLPLRAPIP